MVEGGGSGGILNVPVEATAFLAAVSAFAVFLLVIFIYVNKKWRFFNVGLGDVHQKAETSRDALQGSKSGLQFNAQPDEAYSIAAPDSSSDSEEDVLRRLRHQSSLQEQSRGGSGSVSGSGGGSSTITPSPISLSMRTMSLDHHYSQQHSHHHQLQAQKSFDFGPSHHHSPTLNAIVPSNSSSIANANAGPSSSSSTSFTLRPLRVSSIREMEDGGSASRRRAHHKGLNRSNTVGVRTSSDGTDLISLAEKGKVCGGSSASSTSSNVSAEDDPNHPQHQQHLQQHGMVIRHPHTTTIRGDPTRPLSVSNLPMQSQSSHQQSQPSSSSHMPQQPHSSSASSSNTTNPNFRRMMMPPRTKSVDSESPPPSEQGLSTYGDSIADQDDHIFEVEEMSLVEGELGMIVESGRGPSSPIQCGSLEVAFDYEAAARKMTAHIIQARGIPPKDIGGANNTQIRIVLLPHRKQKHKTKVRPGENPTFMESFVFSKINPEDVSSLGIRLRLYGCERMRRERLLGECILGFGSLHLELETTLWLNFEPRYHLSWDSRSETGSIARSDSASSTASIQSGIPELLVGLAYNGTTGRLTVEIIKGSHFRNLAGGRAPDSYVKLVLYSCSGQEMGRAKSSLRRAQSNPLFKETFMFQVALFQIPEVSVMVSVYGRKGVTRRELLGWFSIGYNSSGDEETTHWEDMCDALGDQMCRWHVLLQP